MVGAQEASSTLEEGGKVELVEPQQMGATFDVQAMRWENLRMATSWVGWRLTEVTLSLNNIFTFLEKKVLIIYMMIVVFFSLYITSFGLDQPLEDYARPK